MTGHTGKLSVFGPNPKWNKMTFYEKKTVVVCALLKPNSISLVGSELVRSWFEPDSVMEFDFEPVCDQLRTSFEPASVMEFGFYYQI